MHLMMMIQFFSSVANVTKKFEDQSPILHGLDTTISIVTFPFMVPFVISLRKGVTVSSIGIAGCCGLYESVEELCHWWKYGHMS